MDFLTDWLTNWLKELLISGIMGNLEGLFDTVNAKVGEIAVQVGTTPAAWNAGVFSLIRQLSETVILPIAGLVLTFVATYELIQMLLEKNNMHEFDVANIYKWVFKTACAILILSNTFNIVIPGLLFLCRGGSGGIFLPGLPCGLCHLLLDRGGADCLGPGDELFHR